MRGGGRRDCDAKGARDIRVVGIRGDKRARPDEIQGHAVELEDAGVTWNEQMGAWQGAAARVNAQGDMARVVRVDIAELILRRDRVAVEGAGHNGCGAAGDDQDRRSGRSDGYVEMTVDGGRTRVSCCERLRANRVEFHAVELVDTGFGAGERVCIRQGRAARGHAQGHVADVVGVLVPVLVLCSDRVRIRAARFNRRRARDDQVRRGIGRDGNDQIAEDAGVTGLCGGKRPCT